MACVVMCLSAVTLASAWIFLFFVNCWDTLKCYCFPVENTQFNVFCTKNMQI